MIDLGILFLSFLVGSIPNGYWIGKIFFKTDLREHGSHNIGATNAGRVLGWRVGFLVLILDASKGAIPVLLCSQVETILLGRLEWQLLIGFVAILGHTFTPFLGGKGGKGVATALGVYLVIIPLVTLGAVGVFLLVYYFFKFVSLGSILASWAMPLLYEANNFLSPSEPSSLLLLGVLVGTAIFITYLHRDNIKRMYNGKELRATNGNR